MTLIQTSAWIALVLCAWQPSDIPSNMFGVLIVSCTLAAVSMRLTAHAAAAAGAMGLLSVLMLVMESRHAVGGVLVLFQLAMVYTVLMVFQACAMHSRFNRTWRLERDSELLIENLHQAKRESDHARELALLASKAKSEFLANMSHELRTPLNAIIGFSDIIRARTFGDSPERYSEYGRFIHQSGHHLLELISDILELAKIEAGRKTLHHEPIDLTSLILDEVARAAEKGASKGVRVSADLLETLPLLRADLHAVRQVLANLLSNAVKFTPAPGAVAAFCFVNHAGEIELVVSDTGIGIAEEDQPLLFERFGQVSSQIRTADRGSGLGLSIVKGLVDMHGGRIRLQSTLGRGTRIAVIFPAESTLQSTQQRVA
jgi:two-component system cell cycle sensor histidine kinase PleC